jgi:hypothetical protein
MISNIEPEEGLYGWNSSKPAVPGLTCKQTASLLTSFASCYRALLMVQGKFGLNGAVAQATHLLNAQIARCSSSPTGPGEPQEVLEKTAIAVGMALMGLGKADTAALGMLASQGLSTLIETREKVGAEKFDSSIIRFNVRLVEAKNPGDAYGIELGTEAIPMEEVSKALDKANSQEISDTAKKIVDDIIKTGSVPADPSVN